MIKHLKMSNIGPAARMELKFGKRLNLLTGDNGLGKSFLLDIAWWAMTRKWPAELNPKLTSGKVALPTDKKQQAEIDFSFSGVSKTMEYTSVFEPRAQSWTVRQGRPANPGLVFYALADGSFAVWDPARNYWKAKNTEEGKERPLAYVFSPKEVWDGLQREDGAWLCNGLIRDWAGWQKEKGRAFTSLAAVLDVLSPSAEEKLVPGGLTRISLDDVRDMPTLKMAYGQEVAVVHASSGMRRIISLAYFLVWCWEEHLKAKELLGEEPETKTVFLVDEVESHLHPKWQRTVIPALMKVMDQLVTSSDVQLIAVTHSPLIMASVEPLFDGKQDAWFDLDLVNNEVALTNRQFVRQGDVRSWLTSEAFDLKSGYSIEAEKVLEEASHALSNERFSVEDAKLLDRRLREMLSDTDPFWMRWRFVAEKKGWLS
ncbi:MAG: AAA family ATPase [Planctomycetes bacterium]|nr:AAA family ATPase [Planctomycetota bacterium]